jgi:hypothetical protein
MDFGESDGDAGWGELRTSCERDGGERGVCVWIPYPVGAISPADAGAGRGAGRTRTRFPATQATRQRATVLMMRTAHAVLPRRKGTHQFA